MPTLKLRYLLATLPLTTVIMAKGKTPSTAFQMMKAGEWKTETLASSIGPLAQAIKPRPFCLEKNLDEPSWEQRAKEEMVKAGLDCQLKQMQQEPSLLAYDIHCKAAPPVEGQTKKSMIPPDTVLDGRLTLARVSEVEYTMDQVATGTGVNLPKIDLGKVSPEQKKLLESALGLKDGGFQVTLKQKYTFVQPNCVKK